MLKPVTTPGTIQLVAGNPGPATVTLTATLTETLESVRAVRHNGGLAMAVVQRVIEPGDEEIGVPAESLDAVCVNPWNEQTVAAWQGEPWEDVEILTGKQMHPTPGKKKTILLGKCMCQAHRNKPGEKSERVNSQREGIRFTV